MTSNKEDFPHRISPELRSRFDYKGLFTLLYNEDKKKFVEFRIKDIIEKFDNSSKVTLSSDINQNILHKIDVAKYDNMRDLNSAIKKAFVDYISNNTALIQTNITLLND